MRSVLLVSNDYPPSVGGIANILHLICSALAPERVAVLAQDAPGAAAFDARQPFRMHRERYDAGGVRALVSTLRYARRVRRIVRETRPDLLYFDKPWPLGMVGLLMRRRGIPYVVHTFGNEVLEPRHRIIERIRAAVLRNAERVIVISNFTRDAVEALGVPRERTAMIRPKVDLAQFGVPVDVDAFKAKEGLAGKRVILTVGRLVERKGMDRVIEALPEIARSVPDVAYVIVGEGKDESRLRELAQRHGVADRVLFPGNRNVVAFYHACDVFAMISRYIVERGDVEGFGVVYLEANACRKPVVGGNSGGVPDAVVDGETGLLVEADDVPGVAAALARLLNDAELRRRMGEAGHARVKREFTLDKYGEEFIRLVLDRHGHQ